MGRFGGYLSELGDSHDGHASPRELEVAVCLSHGMDNEHAANELHISQHTVKNHVQALRGKFNAKTRTHVIAILIRRGLI